MGEEITPARNPFFAGPQSKPQQRPVQQPVQKPAQVQQPVQQVQQPVQKPTQVQQPVQQEVKENFFKKHKKILIISGIVVFVLIAGYLIVSWLGLFGGELTTKV